LLRRGVPVPLGRLNRLGPGGLPPLMFSFCSLPRQTVHTSPDVWTTCLKKPDG